MKKIVIVFLFLAFGISLWAETDFTAILRKLDEMGNFEDRDFSATYTIVSEKVEKGEIVTEVTQAQMYRRDKDKKFLLIILKPDVQKGQGYLKVDENVWFYDPESRQFSLASMKENIQNSDAKNSDLNATSLEKDYEIISATEEMLGKFPVYVLELKAKNNEVSYPKLKLWVRKDNYLLLKEEDYSLSNRLMRTTVFPSYISIGGKSIPSKILLVDELKKGNKTQLTIKDPSLAKIPDSTFTKSYLERVNK